MSLYLDILPDDLRKELFLYRDLADILNFNFEKLEYWTYRFRQFYKTKLRVKENQEPYIAYIDSIYNLKWSKPKYSEFAKVEFKNFKPYILEKINTLSQNDKLEEIKDAQFEIDIENPGIIGKKRYYRIENLHIVSYNLPNRLTIEAKNFFDAYRKLRFYIIKYVHYDILDADVFNIISSFTSYRENRLILKKEGDIYLEMTYELKYVHPKEGDRIFTVERTILLH